MELKEIRQRIDEIDRQIVELFSARMALCADVAQYKADHSLPVLDSARENEKLLQIAALAGDDMADYAVALYGRIFELSRAEQEKCLKRSGK